MVVSTLDELISQLQQLKQTLPGDTPVRLHVSGRKDLRVLSVHQGRVGKGSSTTLSLVSRGGVPAVLLSE